MNKELLHTYFNGETTPDEEKQIMDWAESSPENYSEYLQERKIWNALLVNYKQPADSSVTAGVKSPAFNLWKIVSIAASVALLVSLSWTLLNTANKKQEGLQAVLVPAGQHVQLILEDGTKVWLNSNSSFTYPTSFGNKTREVELNGEGFFEVTKDSRKPFIVKTKSMISRFWVQLSTCMPTNMNRVHSRHRCYTARSTSCPEKTKKTI